MSRREERALREQRRNIARGVRIYTGMASRADLKRPIANKQKRRASIAQYLSDIIGLGVVLPSVVRNGC